MSVDRSLKTKTKRQETSRQESQEPLALQSIQIAGTHHTVLLYFLFCVVLNRFPYKIFLLQHKFGGVCEQAQCNQCGEWLPCTPCCHVITCHLINSSLDLTFDHCYVMKPAWSSIIWPFCHLVNWSLVMFWLVSISCDFDISWSPPDHNHSRINVIALWYLWM